MNGIEATRRVLADHPGVHVVLHVSDRAQAIVKAREGGLGRQAGDR